MKTKRRSWLRAGPLALLLAGLTAPVLAQVSASVTGTVTDNTGAVLAKASVAAVSKDTGVEYPTKSNTAGVYTITGLPIGHYVVKAESPGFKPVTTNAMMLETGQTARVNLKLEVGGVSEEIQVTGFNPILQTENAVVGEVISGSTVVAMPLNGRNFSQLALLVPGVQTHAPDTFTNPKQGTDSGRPYVNGQREQANNYMIDGIDMNEAVDNTVAYYPSPDALAEMKVETNNYSAEFGNAAGGIISAVIKSGTNAYHGSLFEFGRNDALDANSYNNNRSAAKKAKLSQNIFGATLGGPVVKNKIFFFADYQGWINSQPGEGTASLAPAEWRRGDFSSLAVPIIDPTTGKQFPGNVIPQSRISPFATALFSNTTNYPLPNRPGTTGNYVHGQENSTHNHQGDLRVDANLGPKDNAFFRATVGHYNQGTSELVYPLAGSGGTWVSQADNLAASWTHVFSASSVNEFRLGYNHNTFEATPGDPAGVGDYNATIGIPGGQAIPGLAFLDFGSGGIDGVGNSGGGHIAKNKVYQLSDKFSFSLNRHFVTVGGSFLHYNMNQLYFTNSGVLGAYGFDGTATGFPFADFLLNRVARKSISTTPGGAPLQPWTQLQNRVGVFVQDDFKPTSSVTLNVGLRWEYASQLKEENNRQENFDLTNGGVRLTPGVNGVNDAAGLKNFYGGFSPRLGFAWSVNPRTVVRGGFGMVRYMEGTGANCRLTLNPSFGVDTLQTYAGSTGSMGVGMADVPPSTQVRAWQLDIEPQLTKQWNVFAQRELTNTTSLSVGYVGSRATHVVAFDNANQPLTAGGPTPFPQLSFIRYTSDGAVANYDALQASLRRRKSNGLEFLASYTFSKSLTDNQGFYGPGWNGGRSADQNTVGFFGDGNTDFYNKMLDYGRPWFSAKHTGSLSIIYDLPVGKGRAVGNDWSGVTEALLGGWNVSGILTVRSGLPVTVTNGWGLPFMQTRPDIVGNPVPSSQDWTNWIDPAAFANPKAANGIGNSGVGIMDGPGFYNLDMGIDKAFSFGGSRLLTFRLEAFNVLNHSNKGLPNRNWSDLTTFGTITQTANAQRIMEFVIRFAF